MPGGKKIYYLTDGQRRRIGKQVNGKTVQGFVYQSQTQIIAELDGTGKIIKQFIYGSKANVPDYMITNGKRYRIVSDQVGTPKMLIDADTGTVVSRMHYDEFGIRKDGKPCAKEITVPFGFAGGLADDDTGLVHFGARDYDPVVGRWLQRDPILFAGGSTNLYSYAGAVGKVPRMETNLYGYSFSDPVNFIDPSGLIGEDILSKFLTPQQQLAVGTGMVATGIWVLSRSLPAIGTLPGFLTSTAAGFLIYEGGKNIVKAVDDVLTPFDAIGSNNPQPVRCERY